MPIKNKGNYNLSDVVRLQIANDWPTAQVVYTSDILENPSNLYFTNTRVVSAVTPLLTAANIANFASTVNATVQPFLTTANVIETSGNLYFTNARVVSALVAGDSITIEANGRISASLEGNDPIPVTVVNSTQRIISTGALSYTLNTSVASPQNIMVVMEGLVQLPYVDYSTSAYTLTLADSPPVGSNIEIRYFGVDTLNSIRSVSTTVDTFVGNGSNVNFTLSITPPNKNFISINIDGVYQQSDTYSLLNKIVTLSEAPVVGANIDIRILSGVGGSAFNTRNYVGTGTANTFALTEGFTKDTILVFENGVAQVPVIDYDVVNDFLVFTTPPAANINIQVREIGISSIAGGNVIAAIRGFDQYAGNIIPISTLKTLGNSTTKWDKAYLEATGLVLGNTTIGISGSTLTLTTSGTTTVVGADNISPFLLMGA